MPYADRQTQLAAQADHYARNRADYQERNRQRRERLRSVIEEAKNRPCFDCGERHPYYVMDFDHRDPAEKRHNVGAVHHFGSVKALRAEIAKCDVVCANCHRERTHGQNRYGIKSHWGLVNDRLKGVPSSMDKHQRRESNG